MALRPRKPTRQALSATIAAAATGCRSAALRARGRSVSIAAGGCKARCYPGTWEGSSRCGLLLAEALMSDARARIVGSAAVASLVGLAVVSGCASVPMAPAADSARFKRLSAPPDVAVVYLYRNESIGAAVRMDVSLDGRPWGQTVAKSYMVWQVAPGSHRIVSSAENDTDLTIQTAPGRRYFVWQEVKMGLMYARSQLHQVRDSEGQAGVDECELIRMPLPQPRLPQAPAPAPPSPPAQAPASGTEPPTS